MTKPRPSPPPWPRGRPSPFRGSRQPWAGAWGGFHDGRSKLSKRARDIEAGELAEYPAGPVRRRAARLRALADMVEQTIGLDPKSTVRRLTALLAMADRQVAHLERRLGQRKPASIAELARRKASA